MNDAPATLFSKSPCPLRFLTSSVSSLVVFSPFPQFPLHPATRSSNHLPRLGDCLKVNGMIRALAINPSKVAAKAHSPGSDTLGHR